MAELQIEVIFIGVEDSFDTKLSVPNGTTIEGAISLSGVLEKFPELGGAETPMGIYGKKCSRNQLLKDGDRVEIYRPLLSDPRELRRQRAARKNKDKK